MNYSRIGIIGAMANEIELLCKRLENLKKEKKAAWYFYTGKLSGKDVVIVQSGMGKVNMAACAQVLIDSYNVDCILNSGIAGSLCADIDIGDVVISEDCMQHDMDAVSFGYDLGVIPQMKCSIFKADEKLIEVAKNACAKALPDIGVFTGRVLTGDVFVADKERKNFIRDRFGGICTEMEGAAMAQVAWLNEVPFVIVRTISDKADDSAEMDYPEFEQMAILHMVDITVELVAEI